MVKPPPAPLVFRVRIVGAGLGFAEASHVVADSQAHLPDRLDGGRIRRGADIDE
jgi:hypothetical protein